MNSSGFAGFCQIDDTIRKAVLSVNPSDGTPLQADALPTFRVYGPNGLIATGTTTQKDAGTITGATNASPTVITSQGHGLTTGMKVTISGILGNTGANGTYVVTVLTANTFSIAVDTSLGSAYSGGGSWFVVGVYDVSITPTDAANYAPGVSYSVVVMANYSSTLKLVDEFQFEVV